MGRQGDRQQGLSIVEVLVAVAAIAVIGLAGVLVYQHHKVAGTTTADTNANQTNNQQQKTTTQANQQQSAVATHTSTVGGFSFQYPNGWTVTEGQVPSGAGNQEYEINVVPPQPSVNPNVNGRVTTSNSFQMLMYISTNPSSGYGPSIIPDGSTQTSSNGIPLWTSSEAWATNTTAPAGRTVCPELQITSADRSSFNYALPNGKYLTLEAGYCNTQVATTSLTYQQQLSSTDWQAAIALIQSIKFQ